MQLQIYPDDTTAAEAGAALIAAEARAAISQRGKFLLAVSGGSSPLKMFAALTREDVPWEAVQLFQVDERIAPAGHADRNWTHLEAALLRTVGLSGGHLHPMPVEAGYLSGAREYENQMIELAGSPPVFDLVHLGMGSDGHTASLVPGDLALAVEDAEVAVTGLYQGRRRMTLTYPALNRARTILWLIAGESKRHMLRRMLDRDPDIPAGRIRQERAIALVDEAAAGELDPATRT